MFFFVFSPRRIRTRGRKTSSKSEFSVIFSDFDFFWTFFDFFFDFFDVFTQKRTRVNAPIRFANARSWLVVLGIGKKVTGGFESLKKTNFEKIP